MAHLLYSSNEMYSSTSLIRKSKTIFNKIISNEIDKAIILRDGKPSFILLDFDKYEKVLAEYDELKANKKKSKDTKEITTKKTKKQKKSKKKKDTVKKEKEIIIEKPEPKINSAKVVPPTPTYEEEIIEQTFAEYIPTQEEIESQKERLEDTIQDGLEVLKDMDVDDEFKKEVERKVRIKQERDFAIQNEKDIKVEKEENDALFEIQKEKETTQLKEFWA